MSAGNPDLGEHDPALLADDFARGEKLLVVIQHGIAGKSPTRRTIWQVSPTVLRTARGRLGNAAYEHIMRYGKLVMECRTHEDALFFCAMYGGRRVRVRPTRRPKP